jgi:hypothetical protein
MKVPLISPYFRAPTTGLLSSRVGLQSGTPAASRSSATLSMPDGHRAGGEQMIEAVKPADKTSRKCRRLTFGRVTAASIFPIRPQSRASN